MKALLCQIALILGGLVAALSLGINLFQGIDFFTSAFRAVLVFAGTVMIIFLFLHLFAAILVRFVAEQVVQQREDASGTDGKKKQEGAFVRTRTGTVPRSVEAE